jgi:hypothetical protein
MEGFVNDKLEIMSKYTWLTLTYNPEFAWNS